MRTLIFISALLVVAGTAALGWGAESAQAKTASTPQQARKAVERALVFLDEDEKRWRQKHNCATCHHGAMAVWALTEAKKQGYAVDEERLAELGKFAKARFWGNVDKPRDQREGYKIPSSLLIHLALIGQLVPEQSTLTKDELNRLADYVARHQEPEGFFEIMVQKPFFDGRELFTLQNYVAMQPQEKDDANRAARVQTSREKASEWLSKNESKDSPQTASYRLLVDLRTGKSGKLLQPGIDRILGQQNDDGGWSQDKDRASDAYMTGQALYALSKAGVPSDQREIQRAVSFLITNQREDGSWPMTSRKAKYQVPIIYFGSAWATLGLALTVPK
jgi:hypothetical protein